MGRVEVAKREGAVMTHRDGANSGLSPDLAVLARDAALETLPELIGALETAKAEAWARLTTTVRSLEAMPAPPQDERRPTMPSVTPVDAGRIAEAKLLTAGAVPTAGSPA